MMPYRRREFAAEGHFSFSHPPRTDHENATAPAWARPPRPPRFPVIDNPAGLHRGEEDFRRLERRNDSDDSGSGTPSPPLWKQPPYPYSAGSSPARDPAATSRAQAIAGYRREMLDLVRGLPEAAYELSLRDIVEAPPPRPPQESPRPSPEPEGKRKKKLVKGRDMERSVSLDTGLLIKMFLPLSVGGKKKSFGHRGGAGEGAGGAKVSPNPGSKDSKKSGEKKKGKKEKEKEKKKEKVEVEEERWSNGGEFSEAGTSSRTSSTGSSSSSSSSNASRSITKSASRSRSRKRIGCYVFFSHTNKSRTRGS